MIHAGEPIWVYVGTYTRGGDSRGIYRLTLDSESGEMSQPELAGEAVNPSFVVIGPNRKFLYSVSEVSTTEGKKTGGVSAFAIDSRTGKLKLVNQQPSGGAGPCHLCLDSQGKCVLVANYGGGSTAALPVRDDGSLGPAGSFIQHEGSSVNPNRQKGPHAHSVNLDAADRFAVVADLGLDKVLVYRCDPTSAKLKPNDPPSVSVKPGGGPRHFSFHPDGKHAYVINELQSTVTAFDYARETGTLTPIQTISTLPEGFQGSNSTAEVLVHPQGKFLYGSNRGHDSIVVFRIHPETGRLTLVEHESTQGKTPRNFGIDPTGRFLLAANQASDTVVALTIDQETGALSPTGQRVNIPRPVCVRMMPTP